MKRGTCISNRSNVFKAGLPRYGLLPISSISRYIAIYRDMSKISRYVYIKYIVKYRDIRYVSRYIFMVIKVMKLMIIGDIKVFIAINFK